MIDFGVAWDKLAQFETADEIADFFRSEGVTGSCGLYTSCAIAKWMTDTTGTDVAVSTAEMWQLGTSIIIDRKVPHTTAMAEFVQRFDGAEYPDLISMITPELRPIELLFTPDITVEVNS